MIVDRPTDLPLDVMVELYYDYCWDDIMTTGESSIWPRACRTPQPFG